MVGKEYFAGIETSGVKTFKESKYEFRTFAEASSSETRLVSVRIDRIQLNKQGTTVKTLSIMIHTNMEILVHLLFQSLCENFCF